MSKPSKKKVEKKKENEKKDYQKLLIKRVNNIKKSKKEKDEWKLERMTREKVIPIKKEVKPIIDFDPQVKTRTAADIALQMEANLNKLKQMEEEYQKAAWEREGLNEALESEGFKTIKEKMDFLNAKALEQAEKQIEEIEKNKS